jgi:dimethylargininase
MARILTRQPAAELHGFELTFVAREAPDAKRAARQHSAYCDLLRQLGHAVEVLPVALQLPDSIFVEDVAVLFPEVSVLTRPGAVSRQPESALIEAALAGFAPIARIAAPATLEGGDVLTIGKCVYVGQTTRSNAEGIASLAAILSPYGYTVVPVPVHGCLHLKTGVTAVDDETVLLNPAWLDVSAFSNYRQFQVAEGEPWAANVLRLGKDIVMNAASPNTQAMLRDAGYTVHSVDIGEFMKMEAGLTCMSLVGA